MNEQECVKCGKQLKRKRITGMCNSCVKIGRKATIETKLKMRIKALGNKRSLGIIRSLEVRKRISEGHKGERSVFWKGDSVTYETLHWWLIRTYGKATKCENVDCKYMNPKRFEYALIKGKQYTKDRNNYMMLCPSCHRKYDFTEEQRETLRRVNLRNINARRNNG